VLNGGGGGGRVCLVLWAYALRGMRDNLEMYLCVRFIDDRQDMIEIWQNEIVVVYLVSETLLLNPRVTK
jgi:hypothetical protein